MSDVKTNSVPPALLQAKTIQQRLLHAELRAGRRWNWCGKRGWWLLCSLLHEQCGAWHMCRFVATVSEACALLNIQEEDWTWQPVVPKTACDRQSQQPEYVPFLMF
jgi:hypothetical protein